MGLGKKGYFFIVDAIIALTILAMGAILIFSFYRSEPEIEQPQLFSTEFVDSLSRNRIVDINNPYIDRLRRNQNITAVENTIFEQLGEFYYRNKTMDCGFCLELAGKLISNVTSSYATSGISYSISIENDTIYARNSSLMNESLLVMPSRFVVYGLYGKKELYGPYLVEVLLWQD